MLLASGEESLPEISILQFFLGRRVSPGLFPAVRLPNRRCNFSLLRAMPGHLDPYNAVVESE